MKWATCFFLCMSGYLANAQHVVSLVNALPEAKTTAGQTLSAISGAFFPFEISRGMIIVQAQLDGEPGSFIVDTGAPLMVVNKTPDTGTQKEARSLAAAFTYAPETIDRFQWGATTCQNLDALALDISHLEASTRRPLAGMVGYNALHRFEVLFDYPQNRMAIHEARRNDLHETAAPVMEIPFVLQDHLPVITLQIGGKKLTFGIDTGAGINLIDERWLAQLPADVITLGAMEQLRGMDQQMRTVPSATISGLSLQKGGALPGGNMDFLFTDLQHLQSDTGLKIDGVLGFPFFKNLVFSINYPKRKLYIWSQGMLP